MRDERMREALEAARQEIVVAIAFLGRDAGTERLPKTVEQLIERLAKADAKARAALTPADGGGGELECLSGRDAPSDERHRTVLEEVERYLVAPVGRAHEGLDLLAKVRKALAKRRETDGALFKTVFNAIRARCPERDICMVADECGCYGDGWRVINEIASALKQEGLVAGADGWRDIASAPGGGTAIIGYQATEGDHKGRMGVVWRWDDGKDFWTCADYPGLQPTHWQPLPAPPVAGADGGSAAGAAPFGPNDCPACDLTASEIAARRMCDNGCNNEGCPMFRDENACDDAEVTRIWRQCDLPEFFLGNKGTNHRLVAFANTCAARALQVYSRMALREADAYAEEAKGHHLDATKISLNAISVAFQKFAAAFPDEVFSANAEMPLDVETPAAQQMSHDGVSLAIKLIEKRRETYIRENCKSIGNGGDWEGTVAQEEYVSELDDIIEMLRREQVAAVAGGEQDNAASSLRCTPIPVAGADGKGDGK